MMVVAVALAPANHTDRPRLIVVQHRRREDDLMCYQRHRGAALVIIFPKVRNTLVTFLGLFTPPTFSILWRQALVLVGLFHRPLTQRDAE